MPGVKLARYLARLGYGSRREVEAMLAAGRVCDAQGRVLTAGDAPVHAAIRIDGEALDPPPGFVAMLHKPAGYTCSMRDAGRLVFDLLPRRWRVRRPAVSSIGRLDRDTSGLLLFTDDGILLHRVISPRTGIRKVYEAGLAADLRGDEAALFASGTLLLESESTPLAPAELEVLAPREVRLSVTEGRYHQVRRMFAAVGNHVLTLHRSAVGGLGLGDLPVGGWRLLAPDEIAAIGAR